MMPIFFLAFLFEILTCSSLTFSYHAASADPMEESVDSLLTKNADAIIREENVIYSIESPGKYRLRHHRIITILKEGTGLENIRVPYDRYSTAEILEASIYDASGNLIRKVKKSEIADQLAYSDFSFFHDQRVLLLTLSGGRYPFTIEYLYEITYRETRTFSPWIPARYGQSVEKATLTITSPSLLKPHTEDRLGSFIHTGETVSGKTTQKWTLENFAAIKYEEEGPEFIDQFPILLISPTSFQLESYTGSMDSWKSFGQFIYDINAGRQKLSPAMAASVQQMVSNEKDKLQRIRILYSWLQKNTRYVSIQLGIGGWQSFDAAYVEQNKFGDCKALTTFMKGMLEEIGIESYAVLIDWDDGSTLMAKDFATSYFNHMMLHLPSENMWLECTSSHLPAGVIDSDEEGKPVLLITPEGGKLAVTPKTPAKENIIRTIDTLYFEEKWRLRGHMTYSGNTQGNIRSHHHTAVRSEWREMFLDQFPLSVEHLDTISSFADTLGMKAGYSFSLSMAQFGSKSGNRWFIPLNALHPSKVYCTKTEDRIAPYVSVDDHTTINEIYIKLPPGYFIEFLPEAKIIEHVLGRYSLTAVMEGEYLHLQRSLIYMPVHLPAGEYGTVCKFYDEIRKADNAKMVLVSKA
jgi:Domain of Unknown Function with PDB structure (DUF3857)